jgi:hypothetical protein
MGMVKVGKEDVNLDDKALEFSQENINDFLTKYASLHRYYQNKHNDASFIAKRLNDQHTVLFNSKLREYKVTHNLSDKMAEASAKSDEEVGALLERVRMAEYVKDELYGFLKSMDYAHSTAKELCYNMRKEMDSLYGKNVMSSPSTQSDMESKLKDIYGEG